MSKSKIIEVPGVEKLRIAVVDHIDSQGESLSPEWMIKMDSLCQSQVKGFEDFTELLGWYGEASRHNGSTVSNAQLASTATLRHSEVVIVVPIAGYTPVLERDMSIGKFLEVVSIVRLGHIMKAKVKLQQIDFTKCRVHKLQQQLDQLIVYLNVSAKKNTVFVYDQTGSNKGQNVSEVNYATNEIAL